MMKHELRLLYVRSQHVLVNIITVAVFKSPAQWWAMQIKLATWLIRHESSLLYNGEVDNEGRSGGVNGLYDLIRSPRRRITGQS